MYYRGRCSAPLTHTIPICRRISNRESARRLRKQRNEKLNSLLSQQDNLQGINDCLKAQITAAREELLRLTDENRGMLTQLGENVCSDALLSPHHTFQAGVDQCHKPSGNNYAPYMLSIYSDAYFMPALYHLHQDMGAGFLTRPESSQQATHRVRHSGETVPIG